MAAAPLCDNVGKVLPTLTAGGECQMHVEVNGTRLWFDVDGPSLVPEGPRMRQRPAVVLVHGGPGSYDHSYLKPHFGHLAGQVQVVYLDIRDHGRSARNDPADWSFEVCADDVRAFCDTIGIAGPVVLGHSMGGPRVPGTQELARRIQNPELGRPGMDLLRRLDVTSQLAGITCPTLVCVGELDPVTPVAAAREIVGALSPGIGRLAVIQGAGHFPWLDQPGLYWPLITGFAITAASGPGTQAPGTTG
jgi:pimeloyl-ACP methyl ester carboxylesterase